MTNEKDEHTTPLESAASAAKMEVNFVFWRRVLALFIDTCLLGIVGSVIVFAFFDSLVALGSYGKIIGFVIYLLYFGILNSSVGQGRTLGKRLMHIKVVDKRLNYISLPKSILRAAILVLPNLLNGFYFDVQKLPTIIGQILVGIDVLIIFGLGLSLPYLFIVNLPTRQTLHDMAASSFVVQDSTAEPIISHRWKGHLIVVAVSSLALLVAGFVCYSQLAKSPQMDEFRNILEAIQKSGTVTGNCYVGKNTTWTSQSSSNTYLNVSAMTNYDPDKRPASFEQIAKLVAKSSPPDLQKLPLRVRLSYGIDIGIASFSSSRIKDYSIKQLDELRN